MQSERDSAGQHVTASTQGHRGGSTRAGLSTSKPAASHGSWLGAGCQVLSLCVLTAWWLGFENQCPERQASLVAQTVKSPPAMRDLGSIPGREDPLEEGMATPSTILVWKTSWPEEPGGLHSPWSRKK